MKNLFKEIDELKRQIDKKRPFNKNQLKQIKEYYRIGLTYSSNALEGNSLTEIETKIIIEDGITIGGKPLKDHYEAMGHSEAFDYIYQLAKIKKIEEEDIKKLHHLFYYRIDEKNAGKYRKVKAVITGSKYSLPHPKEIQELMNKFVTKLNGLVGKKHPVELSAVFHKEFVFIHPFVDGNGRVARLLMNLMLLREGYNIVIIPPILRKDYIQALEKAHENDTDFIKLVAQMAKESQKDYLRLFS